MTLPRISIVTPSYNQVEFLEQTLTSVLNQRYSNLEYIVMDGGSNDGSVDLIKKYSDRITHWVSEKDAGQSDAINRGFEKATGVIFGWINSDDLLEPGALETVGKYFAENPECLFLNGSCRRIDEHGDPQTAYDENGAPYTIRKLAKATDQAFALWTKRWFAQQSTFWRASLWTKVGGLNQSLHYAMDYDLWRRFAEHSDMHVIPDILASYRFHSDAKCSADWDKAINEILAVQAKFGGKEAQDIWEHCQHVLTLYRNRLTQSQKETAALANMSPSRSLTQRVLTRLRRTLRPS